MGSYKTYLKPILIIGTGIIVSIFIYFNFQNQQRGSSTTHELTSEETRGESETNEGLLDLKEEYFDDLDPVWGSGSPTEWKAFDSEYAVRSKPSPVIHPIEIKVEKIEVNPVKRSEIKTEYLVSLIDQNYEEYGETIGGFFSNKEERIESIEEADVDTDGKPEKLITTTDIGRNHPPHQAYVVKNSTIIASVEFTYGFIKPAKDGNGFYVKNPVTIVPAHSDYHNPLCCPKGYRIYRVVFENNRFVPVWEQDISYFRFKEAK